MKEKEIKIKKFNIVLAILMMLLLTFLMNINVLLAQENHETGLISGYSENIENNKSLITKNPNIIKFEVPKEQHISISLYDESGNLAKILLYDNIQAGVYEYDLTNQLPGGKYFCKLSSGDISESKEVILK